MRDAVPQVRDARRLDRLALLQLRRRFAKIREQRHAALAERILLALVRPGEKPSSDADVLNLTIVIALLPTADVAMLD